MTFQLKTESQYSAREIQNLENVQEKTFIAMQFPIVKDEMSSPPPS